MTIVVTLPTSVEDSLRRAARLQSIAPEHLAAQILEDAFVDEAFPTLEEVVAKIKALPFKPENIRPAVGSLKEVLESTPHDPDFDLETWQREWDKVEEEMRAVTRANSIAEGFDPLP